MSLFDPLGLAAHIFLIGKMILREVWRVVSKWELPIPDNLVSAWCAPPSVIRGDKDHTMVWFESQS